jgi:hypothetical protein
MDSRLLIPVIMCGGAGTRLWPVSRESMPKQFVPLVEERSTFQQVLGRIRDATIFDRPIVITNSDFRFIVAEQMRECAIEGDIVLEPIRRDSAMAVGVAAMLAGTRDPTSTVIVLAADHVVRDPDAFARACREAAAGSSPSASIRRSRRPITAISGRAPSSTAERRLRWSPSSRNRMPRPRAVTLPTVICGTAATSSSAPM